MVAQKVRLGQVGKVETGSTQNRAVSALPLPAAGFSYGYEFLAGLFQKCVHAAAA